MDLKRTRRAFIGEVAAVASAIAVSRVREARAADAGDRVEAPTTRKRRLLSPSQFKDRLEGPIQSNPSPCRADFSVDYDGIRKMIRRGYTHGVRVFGLTAGNSQYHSLSIDEIRRISATMADAAPEEDALIIAAAGDWWTNEVVAYARFAETAGADAVQIMLPSLAKGEDAIERHFRAIADATQLAIVLHGSYSESLLRRLVKIPSIVAMKEDTELTYYIDRQIAFGDRLNIYAGGAENRVLVASPYGARAFFSTYTTFAPDVSMEFWRAFKGGDIKAAANITRKYDYPFIARFTHPFWHATLEYFGVAQRTMRPPQMTLTDAEMEDVKKFFDGQGLNPKQYA
jgi:dihydrodipicolinate synthase/N-acetylneuraminate lyase